MQFLNFKTHSQQSNSRKLLALSVVSLLGASGLAGFEDTRAYANGCDIVGGTGAIGDAYLISDRAELLEISDCISTTQATYFELDANIALTSPIDVIQVGSTVHSFHLDGKGYEITGLEIADNTSENIGLFDYFKGSIKNLDISGTGIASSGNAQAEVKMGTLAGSALDGEVTVENVNITLDAISAEGSGFLQLGGLFGHVSADATPIDITDVSIEIDSKIYADSSAEKAYIGGISSTIPKGNLINIRVSANLDVADTSATKKTSVGGAIASTVTDFDKGDLVLTNFGFEGNITSNSNSASHAGGFIGEYLKNDSNTHEVKIDKSYFRGEISDARYLGGAIGRLEDRNVTADEYVSAFSILDTNFRLRVPRSEVSGMRAAGLVGYVNDSEVPTDSPHHAIEKNFVSALFDGNSYSSSISPAYIGQSSSPLHSSAFVDNYFNDEVYQDSTSAFTKVAVPSNFTALTSAEAIEQTIFTNFDFDIPVWKICAADGGPHLATEPSRCPAPVVQSAPAPYVGPLVTSVGTEMHAGPFQTTSAATVTVYGERLSGVNKVFIENKEALLISTSNSLFVMTLPAGLTDGVHDLVIQSSLGNLTYLDGLLITGETVQITSYGEVSAWTKRISDSQVKVYVKYPTVGERVRIGHQMGGSGSYETVYVKTTVSETDEAMIVNEHGSYIVRTIDLEEINRIRVTVGDQTLVQVRYNN